MDLPASPETPPNKTIIEQAESCSKRRPGQWGRPRDITQWMIEDKYWDAANESAFEQKVKTMTGRLSEDEKRETKLHDAKNRLFERKFACNPKNRQYSMYIAISALPCEKCKKLENIVGDERYTCDNNECRGCWHASCAGLPIGEPVPGNWFCPRCPEHLRSVEQGAILTLSYPTICCINSAFSELCPLLIAGPGFHAAVIFGLFGLSCILCFGSCSLFLRHALTSFQSASAVRNRMS